MALPKPIRKLDEVVINRIAAGEIIQRPANALKELMENSLDAGATNIQIVVVDGGLKLMQIQDNGCGIRKEDFPMVCERFATAKLTNFEDLETISTFGFRGEALASISHVAYVTVSSKTADWPCAYQASFFDGVMKDQPKPIAGNQGTIIKVEDLFHNMSVRKRSLANHAEEYVKITDVVSKYAIHNCNVGFSLKKRDGRVDVRTSPNSPVKDNIRIIYGDLVANELLDFSLENDLYKFKVISQVSALNYNAKKLRFILFINNRLVDCSNLKRAIDRTYSSYLPKNCHPFIYMSLEIEPRFVDVNVHPTKHEVHFLNEEQIIELICESLELTILNPNNARTYKQEKLPFVPFETAAANKTENPKQVYDKDLVRTCSGEQKLEKFFGPSTSRSRGQAEPDSTFMENFREDLLDPNFTLEKQLLETTVNNENNSDNDSLNELVDAVAPNGISSKPVMNSEITQGNIDKIKSAFEKNNLKYKGRLATVLSMQFKIENECNYTLRDIFANHVFVAAVLPSCALIQYETRLILCKTEIILEELFYQFLIFHFENFDQCVLPTPLDLKSLATMGLDLEETGWTPEDGDKVELANKVVSILVEQAPMLDEYFSTKINDEGFLCSIPLLIKDYYPKQSEFPMYILRLATEVNWTEEKECFETFCRETATFFSKIDGTNKNWKHIVEHVVYPNIRDYFCPSNSFKSNGALTELTTLPKLYKVFERC